MTEYGWSVQFDTQRFSKWTVPMVRAGLTTLLGIRPKGINDIYYQWYDNNGRFLASIHCSRDAVCSTVLVNSECRDVIEIVRGWLSSDPDEPEFPKT